MRINLPSLLAQKPIAHPSRVERVIIVGNRLELVVSGYAWWAAGSTGASSPQITLVFEKTSAGLIPACFDQEHDDEHLDNFSIVPLTAIEWARSPRNEIFCHAPLLDSAAIYSMVQAFLVGVTAFKEPGDFLNQGSVLSDFAKLTSNRSYLLARVPDVLRLLLCQALERQGVPYNVIAKSDLPDERLWVRFQGTSFLCESAWAELGS